ncbi:capsule biosynthesis GfcC family protein [Halomonas cerina]|uniref:Capsule biosynthesis GfcC-like C-terminal domain-containing protein n=1 Tax=Halomonas cerina TaxID=447424 RepID=A0A839V4B4_9GAMM|nr:capsule biosynthesis GfcC family protein [Halomonas cerina]MBB3188808.1 hypothetical protein [Halomonas cerina]
MHDTLSGQARTPRFWPATLLILALSLPLALPAFGQAEAPTLRDAWLQQETQPPAGYAFMRHRDDVVAQTRQGRELEAELAIVAQQAAMQGNLAWAHALGAWRQGVAAYHQQPDQARTPGRADITALVANPRHDPPLTSLASYGACQPPSWVEVWHAGGVSRVAYRPELTVSQALREASDGEASRHSDTAWRITPLGQVDEVGIAAWNHQEVEITPGSRLVQRLPLPLDGFAQDASALGAAWIDTTLPHYLATRLPGDRCTLYSATLPTSDR